VPSQPNQEWNPSRTWVFAVGVIQYPDGEHWAQEGRSDARLIEALVRRGVPRGQIAFLTDANATAANVRTTLESVLACASEDDTLLFYFAGHGDKDDNNVGNFVLYDEPLAMPSVFATIERHFRGARALLFADCCFSGTLALDAIHRAGRVSCGVLTSSSASRVSTGAWTFTDCVVKAFEGGLSVDADGDGLVTFRELGRYAEREMAYSDGQLSTFVATPGFDADLVLAKGQRRAHPRIGEFVNAVASDGETYRGKIVSARPGQFEVRYDGYEESDNEWRPEDAVTTWCPPEHPPGTRLEAQDASGDWYPAEVLAVRSGVHLVRYDGYEPWWDEWLDPSRLRVAE
jgi:hypothetical protein